MCETQTDHQIVEVGLFVIGKRSGLIPVDEVGLIIERQLEHCPSPRHTKRYKKRENVCVCVCVCVAERERGRAIGRAKKRKEES